MENEELKEEISWEQIEWEKYRNHPDYNKTRTEYEEEFKQTGGDSFLQFLQQKIESAMGNEFLVQHIKEIYDDVKREEWEHEEWEYRVYGPSRNYKASLEGLGLEELKARYEKVLAENEKCKQEIDNIDDELEYGDLTKSKANKLSLDRVDKCDELEYIEVQVRILQNKIKLEELKSRITEMTPKEIVEEYKKQLSQKQADMARRKYGTYFNITDIEFIDETIGLIEAYSTAHPELETLIAEPKEHKNRIEQGQQEDLSALSLEELLEIIDRNNQTITNNEQQIKQALTQKILGQQQQIAVQKAEISRLQGQKEL